ncbi:MAG: bifunctional UDP-N-acetylglucosamine diphosphorylase/glucosamine-1-phosphate N-acetyltransferase GlmU [Candidatus Babeliaceae bacterium]|nr:bifunctional UDP-N-acetylglucosamine diphosphorylase/glucosamine-1-phosphate N-acetyltransferase GlmU [Candidatus Babeliaceae bacterium]
MTLPPIQAVVLAAGSSSRFHTLRTKLCTPLCGKALINYPVSLLASLNIPTLCVIGYQKEAVRTAILEAGFTETSFVEQNERLGTGHALWCSHHWWHAKTILVLNGDVPFITTDIVEELLQQFKKTDAAASLVVARNTERSAQHLGRFEVQNGHASIIEAKHDPKSRTSESLLNAGIYLFKRSFLETAIQQLSPNEVTGELYLTDLISKASLSKNGVSWIETPFDIIRGINTLAELAEAEQIERKRLIQQLMNQGVRFINPETTIVEYQVTSDPDTTVESGVHLLGKTHLGSETIVGANSILDHATLGKHVTVKPNSIIRNTVVEELAQIGPFANVTESIIGAKAIIGNFVEVKRSTIGVSSKAKHLSYLGDTTIGTTVNIGAGTMICNYNGVAKYPTFIGDNASIGCLNALVAPLTIGAGAITGAGSVITEAVPADALAIARATQVTKAQYAPLLRERLKLRAAQESKRGGREKDDPVCSHRRQPLRHGKLREN